MKIAIIGLGLIGGSICKALKNNDKYEIFGYDIDENVVNIVIKEKTVMEKMTIKMLKDMDITIICLHPQNTLKFIMDNASKFKKGSIVTDVCGIKGFLLKAADILENQGVNYVGTHPMAGREFSGYEYSQSNLFEKASFIITKIEKTDEKALEIIKELANDLKFKKVVISTPKIHDENIAFTSQLAHIVSNAYIKSPKAKNQDGFSAGSFQDLTRVAKLNENMWTELFMLNKEPLLNELDNLVINLIKYKAALENSDESTLKALLKEGKECKENNNFKA